MFARRVRKMNVGGPNWRIAVLDDLRSPRRPICERDLSGRAAPVDRSSVRALLRSLRGRGPNSTAFAEVEGGPLLDAFNMPNGALPSPDLGAFARLAGPDTPSWEFVPNEFAQAGAAGAQPTPSPGAAVVEIRLPDPFPTRTASPAPAPVPAAIAAAAARLILGNSANPLGAGDWRAARAAIGAFYAARGFEPVWVDRNGLTSAGRSALVATPTRGRRRPQYPAFVPPEAGCRRP